MSLLDKIMAKVTPPESDQDRAEARAKAEQLSREHGWLAMVIDHHRRIEVAFQSARGGADAASRRQAFKTLALMLTGHSLAEETVLYPALAEHREKSHAAMSFDEHASSLLTQRFAEEFDRYAKTGMREPLSEPA